MNILVLNAGSSSLRFQLFKTRTWKSMFKGHVDGIGLKTCKLKIESSLGEKSEQKIRVVDHIQAVQVTLEKLKSSGVLKNLNKIKAIGHRVVHGGEQHTKPTQITPKILKKLEKISDLAPLHNPHNLKGIRGCLKHLPHIPNIAVFDTSFHNTLPEKAFLYGLPYTFYKKHAIRKYGFHGTSHAYVSEVAIQWLKKNKKPFKRLITCHIGNGVSVTAIKNGKSIDTSMGFTPLEGAMMGTRAGDFDPAILIYLLKKKQSLAQLDHILQHESGLKGLSEISSDMRALWTILKNPKHSQYKKAKRAYDVYVYRLSKIIASYLVPLGGLDGLIFTAGIGENAWYVRRDICKNLAALGVKIDPRLNQKTIDGKFGPIHSKASKVGILVIPTQEELQIAKTSLQTYFSI